MARRTERRVIVGVDTHDETHTARAKDHLGHRLGELEIPTTPAGYGLVLAWARRFGEIEAFGIEGTGSYGAGLARYLQAKGYQVLEVMRPKRQYRRQHGKSDPADAEWQSKPLGITGGAGSRLTVGGVGGRRWNWQSDQWQRWGWQPSA